MKKYIFLLFLLSLCSISVQAGEMVKGAEKYVLTGEPSEIWEAETGAKYRTGRTVRDAAASGKKARYCDIDNAESELLLYGQYRQLKPGKYIAVFSIRIDNAENVYPDGGIVNLSVTCGRGAVKYCVSDFVKGDFGEGYTLFPMPFEVKDGQKDIEALIKWNKNCDIWADKVEIYSWAGELPAPLNSAVRRLNSLNPGNYPNGLSYTSVQSAELFPVSAPPSKKLFVIDTAGLPTDMCILLAGLQGLVNRVQPRLYLSVCAADSNWLSIMKDRGDIASVCRITPKEALDKFKAVYHGCVVTDPRIPATVNAATMYAAVNDLLICSPRLAREMKLPIRLDMRGRFADNSEPYYWAWAVMGDKLCRQTAFCLHWDNYQPRDYIVQHKLFVFWVPGRIDAATPVSSPKKEMQFADFFLSQLPANTPVMGYPWAGVDVGIGEGGGVGLFAEYGHYLVGTDKTANLSVHSGTRPGSYKQKEPRRIKIDYSKRYVAFSMSDGDNLLALIDRNWPALWQSRARGKVPITWTISPASCVLLPDIMDYYYSTAADNDTFGAAVSGVGYTYPALYGKRFRDEDRQSVFDGFLTLTDRYMKRMDLRVLFPMNVTPKEIALMAKGLPDVKGLFPDYGRGVKDYESSIFLTYGNTPVLRSGTTWDRSNTDPEYIAKRMAKELTDFPDVSEGEPAFIHAFLWNWGFSPDIVNRAAELVPDNYVFVSAEEMAALEKEYLQSKRLILSCPDMAACIEGCPIDIKCSMQNTSEEPFDIELTAAGLLNAVPVKETLLPGIPCEAVLTGIPTGDRVTIKCTGRDTAEEVLIYRYAKSALPPEVSLSRMEIAGHWSADSLKSSCGADVFRAEDGIPYRAAINGENKNGAVIYGPYQTLEPGRYMAAYNLMRLDEKGDSDVVCEPDIVPAASADKAFYRKLTRADLPVGKKITLYAVFDWDTSAGVETRVFWKNTADSVRVDGVSIFRIK